MEMSDLVIGLNRSTHERGRSLTTLTRRDRYGGNGNVNVIYRFSLIIVEEFLHQCQSGVDRWSMKDKIWST